MSTGFENKNNYQLRCGLSQHLLYFPYPESTMIVCLCQRVSDRDIARHARNGMSFDEIQLELGVATQCGCCGECARDIVSQCHAQTAALHRAGEPVTNLAGEPGFNPVEVRRP